MGTPATRTPVRVARGTYSNLNTNKADILEGEICYAHDQNKIYIKEGSNLEEHTIDTSSFALIAGTTFTGDIIVDNAKELRFEEASGNGNNYVGFEAPATLGGDQIWVLPTADGSAGQLLKTDGSGNLGWATDSTTDATKLPLAGGTMSGDLNFSSANIELASNKLIFDSDSGNTHEITFKGPASITADQQYTLPAADSSGAQFLQSNGSGTLSWATGGDATLAGDNTWTGAQRGQITSVNSAATITLDMSTTNNFHVTALAHNTTFAAPSNQVAGQSGSIFITQDGTGSRTAAWHANFKWKGGTAPTLSTAAASVDRIDYIILASGTIHAVATLDVK